MLSCLLCTLHTHRTKMGGGNYFSKKWNIISVKRDVEYAFALKPITSLSHHLLTVIFPEQSKMARKLKSLEFYATLWACR